MGLDQLLLLLFLAAAYLAAWPFLYRRAEALLPPQRSRLVAWTGIETAFVFILASIFLPSATYFVLAQTSLGSWIYGDAAMAALHDPDAEAGPIMRLRLGLLASALAVPLQIVAVVGTLNFLRGVRPYQLGLTIRYFQDNLQLGGLFWALLTPFVLMINWLAAQALSELDPRAIEEHPFVKLRASGSLSGGEMGLLILQAAVLAPMVEELIFRGMLLRWLSRSVWGSVSVVVIALLWALPLGEKRLEIVRETPLAGLAPVGFVLLMACVFALMLWRNGRSQGAAIWASSLLFAILHVDAWPAPIPLFALALGLGWLAQRTQSLVGPIVFHALFNAVACVQMLVLYPS